MEVLFPAVLGLLLIGGAVTFFVLAKTSGGSGDAAGGDATPLGDTDEHAGRQRADGSTVSSPETSGPEAESEADRDDRGAERGGSAEPPRPATESERLANREP